MAEVPHKLKTAAGPPRHGTDWDSSMSEFTLMNVLTQMAVKTALLRVQMMKKA